MRRLQSSAHNVQEMVEFGRLGDPWGSPYEIVHASQHYRLRRYAGAHDNGEASSEPSAGALLLVPPLMVTSEVYDVAPDVSAVAALTAAGLDVWLVDFGAPEREEGGLERTLDDHVLAVDDAIARVATTTGRPLHLVGYSQGGMFCYLAAAYRRCEDIASLVTFGSPVDIHRNLPAVDAALGGRVIGAARRAIAKPLAGLDALPGVLTSTGFKALSLRKELQQISEFLTKLHDRDALIKRESRRRFLGGEGFVAWPGPALRTFIDEFIVANRMSAGGFVIAGRTASLAELTVPILCCYGERDDIARAASVRAIVEAAPQAEIHQLALPAGHFGLVVGSTATQRTWPTVSEWVAWRDLDGPRPRLIAPPEAQASPALDDGYDEIEGLEIEADFEPIVDIVGDAVSSFVGSVKDAVDHGSRELGGAIDDFRYQLPRLRKLERLDATTRVSLGLELSDRAARHPERTFFLWEGRAFSYAEADRRVDAIVRGLIDRGVKPGARVGVLMDGRPSYLSVVAAINRLGAIAVLLKPDSARARDDDPRRLEILATAVAGAELVALIADPLNVDDAIAAWASQTQSGKQPVLVLGGGRRSPERPLPADCYDMETINPELVRLPDWYVPNPGRAADVAMTIVTTRAWAPAREANISNGRWAVSAYGAAATCLLSSRDTVYCVLPLHHPAGALVAVGGALVGRARLALARDFDAATFWPEVRRYGATVVFYAGEMCRALINAPPSASENNHSLRLLAGSGMRAQLWRDLVERFGPLEIREFYASTEGNLVLANVTGKRGALGRPLPGTDEIAIVAYDFERRDFERDAQGRARRCRVGEAGLLIAKVGPTHPSHGKQGKAGTDAVASFERGVFGGRRTTWFVTGDIVRCDSDGDYWYVDRSSHLIRGPHGWIASRQIEDALFELPGLDFVVVFGLDRARVEPSLRERIGLDDLGTTQVVVAVVIVSEPETFDPARLSQRVATLRPEQRPSLVILRTRVPLTDGFRPLKTPLVAAGVDASDPALLIWDAAQSRYQ
ncbi:Long-chain-fatty-acid--CoA ligase FadD17 [Enhygromyxa salina]|uniref:Long-chain-fatty-acid--CoA ligase FadD17 n=1 Tax=Enhygromyxa salina TaxID=215803 RepID=A0A2S9YMC3_9BACT|nr:Long-chain-fatty-acid--CoA ligase FadD17 [Enhygromyxa salina]